MTNAQRVAAHVEMHGPDSILVHAIPGTQFWLVAEKIEHNMWALSIMHPLKNSRYQVGVVSNRDHLKLWHELTTLDIDRRAEAVQTARQLRTIVRHFLADAIRENYQNILATHVEPQDPPEI